jgi:branched-subunit amino acid ABC-type transport system permease component
MGTLLLYVALSLPLIGAYALLGLGITVIYQASRVLNLAHGALAMSGAYAVYQLVRWHVPVGIAVVGGVVAGALLGLLVERVLVRRLRPAGPTTQTVGTVAALTLAIAIVARVFGSSAVSAPRVLPDGAVQLGGGYVSYDQVGVFPIALLGAAALFALFQLTDVGLAMRGAAQNRRGAALRGVDPDRTAALAWLIGGALAGLAGILLAGATSLDPYNIALGVLPAFVAALIGGLESMPGVCLGAAIIGGIEGVVPALAKLPGLGNVFGAQGAPQLVLGLVALAVMASRGSRLVTGDVRAATL